MDMSAAYRKAVRENLPEGRDRLRPLPRRQALQRQAVRPAAGRCTARRPTPLQKRVLKGTRWLLLKDPENLDAAKDEKRRLKEALQLNEPLAAAYYLKEELRRFWEQPGKRFATRFLDGWLEAGGGLGDQDAAADGQDAGGCTARACWRTTTR